MLTLSTPYQWKDRKMKTSMTPTQLRWTIEKNRKKENIFQNKCALVSSQNRRSKKRRGRHCSGVSPTFSLAKQRWLFS